MAHKQGEAFIKLLSSQLQNDGPGEETTGKQLTLALQESVASLPESELKQELSENLSQYASKLQRTLKRAIATSNLQAKWCRDKSPGEGGGGRQESWVVNALTSDGLKTALKALENVEEKYTLYEQLVFCSQTDAKKLGIIFNHWSSELVVAGAQAVVEAVDVCTRLTAGSLRHSLLPWLRFCFEVFGSTLERQLSATVGKETESVRAETATLVPSLLHTIMLAHFRKQTMHVSFKVTPYFDLVSGLVSILIDLTLLPSSVRVLSEELLQSTLLAVLGTEERLLLDTVLQVTSQPSRHSAQLMLPLIRRLFELCSKTAAPSPAHFLKLVCCSNKARELATHSPQNLCSNFGSVEQPPANLLHWLWNANPSVCEWLGLGRQWSESKTVKFILKLNPHQTERLLDMVITVETSQEARGRKEGKMRGEEESGRGKEGKVKMKEQSSKEEEGADCGERGEPMATLFFVDTAGSAGLHTSSDDDPGADQEFMSSEEETLLPSIDELIQRLPTYSSSDEQAVQNEGNPITAQGLESTGSSSGNFSDRELNVDERGSEILEQEKFLVENEGGQSPGSATPEPAASSPPGPSCTTTPHPRPSPSPRVERRVLRSARKAKHLSTAGSLQSFSLEVHVPSVTKKLKVERRQTSLRQQTRARKT